MKPHINVAVVGCGYWGPNLIRNFKSLTNGTVKLACDINQRRLEDMTRIYPDIEAVSSFDEVLVDDDVAAVAIATPVASHYPLAKKCLLAGKHTFIEKPFATSSAECSELIDIARQNHLVLMVGHTFLYSSPVRKIKEIVDTGEIGDVLYISSRRLNLGLFQKDINVFWDLAPHDISIILYVMGDIPLSVNCQGKAHFTTNIEDVTTMTLNFSNGGFATIHNSWLDPSKVRQMTFVGSRKMIVYDDTEPLEKLKIYDKRVEPPPHYETFAEFYYSYHYGDIYTPYIKQVEPLKVECEHFIDCIQQGCEPITSGTVGLQVVQILEAASQSLHNGGVRVDIDRLEPEPLVPHPSSAERLTVM
ncbi:MAG TPA: Gfo/Idh/MocA family oxidoreductase [Thermodesulfobacteriota bacterium]|nr:Gfo/Idh/MocA family oxidoreductase [Thermodesulfobacteriota bacterium]